MSQSKEHLGFVDGLRGMAVLMVLCRHLYMHLYHLGLPRWADVFGLGYLGVHMFLLLSGFCVAWAYVGPHPRPFAWKDFCYRRIVRILPPYYAALLIAFCVWLSAGERSSYEAAFQLATHLTMTHNLHPDSALALNSPFWSLALEAQLYVIFPWLFLGMQRFGARLVLPVILVLQLSFRWAVIPSGTDYNDLTFVLPWGLPGRLLEFALGVWCAGFVSEGRGERLGWAHRVGLGLLAIAALVTAVYAKQGLGVTHPAVDLAWTVCFCCVVLLAASPHTFVHRVTGAKPLRALGGICYSVYLIHELVMGQLVRFLSETLHVTSPAVLAPCTLAAILICSYAFYLAVEKRAISFFASASRHRVARATAPGSFG